jgi:hypothetical protein
MHARTGTVCMLGHRLHKAPPPQVKLLLCTGSKQLFLPGKPCPLPHRSVRPSDLRPHSPGVNPLAGCLPTLATIPVFIGLYRALTLAAQDNLLDQDFFWIPSLAGPSTVEQQQAVRGTTGIGRGWFDWCGEAGPGRGGGGGGAGA